ncbi:porin family protein [Roseivirga sp. BDSF3-8]|uniref:porin family protein n=1 Tax=Roseivirga sp. BDSF3-8 TaxID=3241598 RepID=UPI0035325618
MKRQPQHLIFWVGLLCLITVFESQAQPHSYFIGVKGGLNFACLTYSPEAEDESIHTGFSGGLFAEMRHTDNFSIRTELLYSERGSRSEWEMGDELIIKNINLQYADFVLLASIDLGESGYFEAGPYAGCLIRGRMRVEPGGLDDPVPLLSDHDFRRIDYGIAAGLGFRFGQLMIGARYYYGLADVARSATARSMLDSGRNRGIQLTIGVGI